MISRPARLGAGLVPVLVFLLVLGLIGGGVGLTMWLKAKQVADAVAALDRLEPPDAWNASTKTDKKKKAAWARIQACYDIGDSTIGALQERLTGAPGPGLEAALVALGRLGADDAVPAMIPFLTGDDARLGQAAAYGFAKFPSFPKAVTALLDDASAAADRRVRVYQAHAWSGDKHARRKVAKGLEDADPAIRSLAVRELGNQGTTETHAALVGALADADAAVGEAAVTALSDRPSSARSDEGRAALVALCGHERPAVRARALTVCARSHELQAKKAGVAALDAAEPEVATAAALVVKATQAKEGAARLVPMLTRPEPDVVDAATEALKEVGEGDIDARLVELLEHAQPHTRIAAARLLAFVDGLALKVAMRRTPWVLADGPAVPRLIACTQGEGDLADAAHNALASFARLAHFKNRDRSKAAWQDWLGKLQVERTKIGEIEAVWNAAIECFEARRTTEYKGHIHALRDAVGKYEELKELGSTTNYEGGAFGIKKINEQLFIMGRTAGGLTNGD